MMLSVVRSSVDISFLNFRECLSGAIEHCDAPQVTCPYKDEDYSCDMTLLDREIKAVSTIHHSNYSFFLVCTKYAY